VRFAVQRPASELFLIVDRRSVTVPPQRGSDFIKDLLTDLRFGPKWPKTLALNLATIEAEIYPDLSEGLARGWIAVVSPAGLPSEKSDPCLGAALKELQELLDTITPSETDRLRDAWFAFLSERAPLVSFCLTAAGYDALSKLDVLPSL